MKGAPGKAIQELAAHANLTTTLRYMHLSPAARTSAIALLNDRGKDGAPRSWQGPSSTCTVRKSTPARADRSQSVTQGMRRHAPGASSPTKAGRSTKSWNMAADPLADRRDKSVGASVVMLCVAGAVACAALMARVTWCWAQRETQSRQGLGSGPGATDSARRPAGRRPVK
jgi:hypothetical protein